MAKGTVAVTDASFDGTVVKSDKPVLVDFWAPWCGPCVAIGPVLETLAEEYKDKISIVKMNVDENANVPASLGVRSIPYLVMYKNGKMVDSIVGAVPKAKLKDMIDRSLV